MEQNQTKTSRTAIMARIGLALLMAASIACGGGSSTGATSPASSSCPAPGSTVSAAAIGNFELAREMNGCDVQAEFEMHTTSWGNWTCMGSSTTGTVPFRLRAPGTTPGDLDPAILATSERSIANEIIGMSAGQRVTLRGQVEAHAFGGSTPGGCVVFRASSIVAGN